MNIIDQKIDSDTNQLNKKCMIWNSVSETLYRELSSLHIWHSLNNRPYDNLLFHSMIKNIWEPQNKLLLDFGCGHWYYANFLLQSWIDTYGVDIDDKGIETANLNSPIWSRFSLLWQWGINNISELWLSFDAVYSMYVYETIKDKSTIAQIFSDIFSVMKDGWLFQFVIWNVEEFYWKKCIEFEFPKNSFIEKLTDGDPYIARLIWENWFFDVQDFYHSQEMLIQLLKNAEFKNISISRPTLNGDEYFGMKDEINVAPSIIFMAQK